MDNCFIRLFNHLIILLQIFISLAYMLLAAFRMEHDQQGEDYKIYETRVNYVILGVESIFLLDLLLKFFKEYIPEHSSNPDNKFGSIVNNYITGQLIFDLIPLLPF